MTCYRIVVPGAQATTGASSALTPIPNDSSGKSARRVYIQALGPAFILPTVAGGSVTAAGGILVTANTPLCLDTSSLTHIAHIQSGASTTINISPVES